METVQLCICREHIVMGHSRAARGKTYWCMSEIAALTHLLCGGLWCAVHPIHHSLSLSSAWSTQWVPGRPGLHRETSTQRKTSGNKQQQQQKPLMSKRSLLQESVYAVLMIRQCLRMPTTQLRRRIAETSRLLEKVAKQESDTES